jgi:YegS/Rv2252/BmrU family lipid kinase
VSPAADARPSWLAILNPVAGGGGALRAWPKLAAALAAAGVPCEVERTLGPGHATELAAAAQRRGVRRLLAVGGDGTLHEIVNGLDPGGARVALAVAATGTGNDWARGLGLPRSPAALAAVLRSERRRAHDLGIAEYQADGGRRTRRFLNVAGVGYDADVLDRLPRRGPRRLRYLWAVVAGLPRYRAARFTIDCAGERIEAPLLVAFAAIGRFCGGGLEVAPGADPGDGLLDLLAVRAMPAYAALARLPKLYLGRFGGDPSALGGRGAEIRFDADRPVGVEADGQRLGSTPLCLHLQPGAIDAVVP